MGVAEEREGQCGDYVVGAGGEGWVPPCHLGG